MRPRVVGIVPMRHTSERVPGKNYRVLGDRPLFHHIVTTLLAVPEIDEVVIDTDSPVIQHDAYDTFPDRVRVVPRPDHLVDGAIPMNEVLLNTIEHSEADWYVQTHSTNPLLQATTVSGALRTLWSQSPPKDSLFSVSRLQTRLWWSADRAVNHDPEVLLRTQDLPAVYEENSNIYIFTADSLRSTRSRIGRTPVMYEIDKVEAWDIDDEADFVMADLLVRRMGQLQ